MLYVVVWLEMMPSQAGVKSVGLGDPATVSVAAGAAGIFLQLQLISLNNIPSAL